MDTLPLLKIDVSAGNQIVLEFQDPATGVLPSRHPGFLDLPDVLIHPESDPLAHGRALREALLSSTPVSDEFLAALSATIHAPAPRPLRISLGLPAQSEELHDLGWETLSTTSICSAVTAFTSSVSSRVTSPSARLPPGRAPSCLSPIRRSRGAARR